MKRRTRFDVIGERRTWANLQRELDDEHEPLALRASALAALSPGEFKSSFDAWYVGAHEIVTRKGQLQWIIRVLTAGGSLPWRPLEDAPTPCDVGPRQTSLS